MAIENVVVFITHFFATLGLVVWPILVPARTRYGLIAQGLLMLMVFFVISMMASWSLFQNG